MRSPTIKMIENFRSRIAKKKYISKITFQGQTVYRNDGCSMDSKDIKNMTNEEILECLNRQLKILHGIDYWIKQKETVN